MRRVLILAAACAWLGAAMGIISTGFVLEAVKPINQMTCPAGREVWFVRCPGRDEITGNSMSCKQKVFIDECAKVALGGKK